MTQNKIKIAITGGIGSGKTTVSEIIEGEGFPVFSCDKIYRDLFEKENFIKKIANEYDGVVRSDGSVDRRKLSNIVFNDEIALKKLNEITHPAIMDEALFLMNNEKISFCEVPLLFESGFETLFDEVIIVLRNESERIKFVSKRDKISQEEVKLRIKHQINYDNYDFAKYYVIHNDGDFDDLRNAVLSVLEKIVKKF